ncbi:MAG: aminotransferase class I/II-fold pyridoxal phosphate-dependent enzyme [Bacillota bacterium]|jgi:arginine decarboxylase
MTSINQNKAPLVEALVKYAGGGYIPFHMPGHKGVLDVNEGHCSIFGKETLCYDLTELEGLDDLHNPSGPIKEAQELAANLMNAQKAYFLVNGVSSGLHGAIMAAVKKKGKVLVPRHAHRSIYGVIALCGLTPVYVKPWVHSVWGTPVGIDLREVESALNRYSDIECMIAVHPTYHGFAGDLLSLVRLAKKHNVKVLVDEAHGAHFSFSPEFPVPAVKSGAAAVLQGWHKTMGSLTQSGMLLLNDHDLNVFNYLTILQTTSPSYLLMGSLDGARRCWATKGQKMARELLDRAYWFRKQLKEVRGINCLDMESVNSPVLKELDITKIVLNGWELGLNGFQLAQVLRDTYQVQPEMAEYGGVTLMFTIGDTKEKIIRLLMILKDIAHRFRNGKEKYPAPWHHLPIPQMELLPGEALHAQKRTVHFKDSEGEIAGEFICPYPPGIPLIVPGEIISREVIDIFQQTVAWGGKIQGPADPSGATLKVIKA